MPYNNEMVIPMTKIWSVDLRGAIADVGSLSFLRAEWHDPKTNFLQIHCSLQQDVEQPSVVLVMDMGKRAFIGVSGMPDIDDDLRKQSFKICENINDRVRPYFIADRMLANILSPDIDAAMREVADRKGIPLYESFREACQIYVQANAPKQPVP